MRLVFKIAWRTALALFMIVFVYLAVTFFQVWRTARKDAARPSDAIVVLGAAQYDGRPSPVLAARLDHALDLYRAGVAPIIVVTGGRQEGDRFTEATAGATYLHEHGVPDTAILRETSGRSSWQSLAAAGPLPQGTRPDPGRARLGPVSRGSHRRHRRRGRAPRGDVADNDQPDQGCGGVAPLRNRDAASRRRPAVRLPPARARSGDGEGGARTRYADPSFGGGVIGNTTGSGPVFGGSSPPPERNRTQAPLV